MGQILVTSSTTEVSRAVAGGVVQAQNSLVWVNNQTVLTAGEWR